MPKVVKRVTKAPAPVQALVTPTPAAPVAVEPTPTKPEMSVVYDKLSIIEYSVNSPQGPLTPSDWKTMLGWETEKEYQKRKVQEVTLAQQLIAQNNSKESVIESLVSAQVSSNGIVHTSHDSAVESVKEAVNNPDKASKPEHWLFGDTFHCRDTSKLDKSGYPVGDKVRCWNNANNRPFDEGWCMALVHTILHGQWAGPLMVPGETVNGETVRISKYARVLSGQHQGTAAVLADEYLQLARKMPDDAVSPKYPIWVGHEHPVIETIVITGLSEDERVLRTIDYVKPRTTADMLYTMELFRQNTSVERKEMTRMLASAIDMLWTRTDTKGYKTHPEIVGFLERHKRLLKCVEHLFIENKTDATGGRRISKLRLGAGQCAALCYLMACSDDCGVDNYGDVYRNESPPSEKCLNFNLWDKAQDFWVRLAQDRAFILVRTALGHLVDSTPDNDGNQGMGGRLPEKLAIIQKAWDIFRDHPTGNVPFMDSDLAPGGALCLSYSDIDDKGNKLPDGQIKLLDIADFLGIDCPEVISKGKKATSGPPESPPPTQAEIERGMEEVRSAVPVQRPAGTESEFDRLARQAAERRARLN